MDLVAACSVRRRLAGCCGAKEVQDALKLTDEQKTRSIRSTMKCATKCARHSKMAVDRDKMVEDRQEHVRIRLTRCSTKVSKSGSWASYSK